MPWHLAAVLATLAVVAPASVAAAEWYVERGSVTSAPGAAGLPLYAFAKAGSYHVVSSLPNGNVLVAIMSSYPSMYTRVSTVAVPAGVPPELANHRLAALTENPSGCYASAAFGALDVFVLTSKVLALPALSAYDPSDAAWGWSTPAVSYASPRYNVFATSAGRLVRAVSTRSTSGWTTSYTFLSSSFGDAPGFGGAAPLVVGNYVLVSLGAALQLFYASPSTSGLTSYALLRWPVGTAPYPVPQNATIGGSCGSMSCLVCWTDAQRVELLGANTTLAVVTYAGSSLTTRWSTVIPYDGYAPKISVTADGQVIVISRLTGRVTSYNAANGATRWTWSPTVGTFTPRVTTGAAGRASGATCFFVDGLYCRNVVTGAITHDNRTVIRDALAAPYAKYALPPQTLDVGGRSFATTGNPYPYVPFTAGIVGDTYLTPAPAGAKTTIEWSEGMGNYAGALSNPVLLYRSVTEYAMYQVGNGRLIWTQVTTATPPPTTRAPTTRSPWAPPPPFNPSAWNPPPPPKSMAWIAGIVVPVVLVFVFGIVYYSVRTANKAAANARESHARAMADMESSMGGAFGNAQEQIALAVQQAQNAQQVQRAQKQGTRAVRGQPQMGNRNAARGPDLSLVRHMEFQPTFEAAPSRADYSLMAARGEGIFFETTTGVCKMPVSRVQPAGGLPNRDTNTAGVTRDASSSPFVTRSGR